jgi:hypothetical protein
MASQPRGRCEGTQPRAVGLQRQHDDHLRQLRSSHGEHEQVTVMRWHHHRTRRRPLAVQAWGSTTTSLSSVHTTTTVRSKRSASACARSSILSASSRRSAHTCVSDFGTSTIPNHVPKPKISIGLRICHNHDVSRTQWERPHISTVCDKSAHHRAYFHWRLSG